MKLHIISTTDGKYIGTLINYEIGNSVVLSDGTVLNIDKIIPLDKGIRLINSNYVIDTEEV